MINSNARGQGESEWCSGYRHTAFGISVVLGLACLVRKSRTAFISITPAVVAIRNTQALWQGKVSELSLTHNKSNLGLRYLAPIFFFLNDTFKSLEQSMKESLYIIRHLECNSAK